MSQIDADASERVSALPPSAISGPFGLRNRPMATRWLGLLLVGPMLLGIGLAVWVTLGVEWDWAAFRATIQRVTPATLAGLCLLHVAQQLGRTLRLALLLPRRVSLARLASIVMLHQFFAAMLPLKLGSFSMPEMLKRQGIDRSGTLATMFTYAGMELWATIVLIAAAGWLFQSSAGDTVQLQRALLAICICLFGGAAAVFGGAKRFDAWLQVATDWISWSWFRPVASRVQLFLRTLRALPPKRAAQALALTLLNTVLAVSFSLIFCQQLAPQLDWRTTLLIVLLMRVFGQFAIQGLAGVGTSEPILVLLFCAVGLSATQALTVTVLGRAFGLALIVSGACVGAVIWFLLRRSTVERTSDVV